MVELRQVQICSVTFVQVLLAAHGFFLAIITPFVLHFLLPFIVHWEHAKPFPVIIISFFISVADFIAFRVIVLFEYIRNTPLDVSLLCCIVDRGSDWGGLQRPLERAFSLEVCVYFFHFRLGVTPFSFFSPWSKTSTPTKPGPSSFVLHILSL